MEMQSLVAAHERYPLVLDGLLGGVSQPMLRGREAEGRWSPLEILVHLRDEEVEDFRPRARAAAAARPLPGPIDPQGWVASRRYNEQDPEAVLADFRRERRASCEWLRSLSPEALAAATEHAALGRMSAADFIAAWRMHDLLHLRQLATALARLEARTLAGHRIEYAGDVSGLAARPPNGGPAASPLP